MRWLTCALLLAVALSGCLESDVEPAGLATPDSVPVPLTKVVMLSSSYEAAPGLPATFDVQVPAGAVNVVYEITTGAVPGQAAAQLELQGCGSDAVEWGGGGNIVIAIGSSDHEGDLCDAASSGTQEFTISVNAVPLSGSITLRAEVPRE